MTSHRAAARLALLVLSAISPGFAFQPRQESNRFDQRSLADPAAGLAVRPLAAGALSPADPLRAGWDKFGKDHGGWQSWIDARSGLPALAIGHGIPWFAGPGNALAAGPPPTVVELAARARRFVDENPKLLGRWGDQLVLDVAASGPATERLSQITFRQVVGGVPVDGARYDFQIVQGNLVSFGASNWSEVRRPVDARTTREEAWDALLGYLGVRDATELQRDGNGTLVLRPIDPRRKSAAAWDGARGRGYDHLLVWRFTFTVPGEPATWVADVDADAAQVLALRDDTRYDRIKGGVFPLSNDGICPSGCEQANLPMPYADVGPDGGAPAYTNDFGVFDCTGAYHVRLAGQYILVSDRCGTLGESGACNGGVDLKTGPGTDCAVPPGMTAGDTHASRSSFYHLNRAMQNGRAWLPDNGWLRSQVTDNVNINNTCNAFWNGTVNFYRSGGGCRNTGEIAGVFVHEWGHGLDFNDGGGGDNPSEAYADIVANFMARESCVGRGFYVSGNCGGYGDPCLDCTGIRDQDWDKHASHTPATPANFAGPRCGGGGGPCGREEHCEGYVGAETLYDLAARDLPALGLDTPTSWQIAEKLWYTSRKGSGGNAYNCALPSSDGCGASTWFNKLRVADDDDGNLANGTPHAAAIFAAFDRHGIACGATSDAANLSSVTCPVLAKPAIVQATKLSGSVRLAWTPVAGATQYRVLRSDLGCDRGHTLLATVSGTAYTDNGVPDDFTTFYRVQATAAGGACDSLVSNCESQRAPQTAYVTEIGKGALSAVALSTGSQTPLATGLSQPAGVSTNRALTFGYVTEQGAGRLSRVDLGTGAKTIVATGLSSPRGTPRLNAAETEVLVAEAGSGNLSRVTLSGGAVTRIASGLSTPIDVDTNAEETFAYVTESGSGRLSRVNIATGGVAVIATGLNSPRFVTLDAKQQAAFVTEGPAGTLARVDLYTGQITRPASGIAFPLGLDLGCSEDTAFVVENASGEIGAVSLANGAVTPVASNLSQPSGLTLRRDDPNTRAIPHEIRSLTFSNQTTLTWGSDATYAGAATTYDVLYGDIADVATYAGSPNDRCLADDLAATSVTDGSPLPAPGRAWFFLVRGNNTCGAGRLQAGVNGADRVSSSCR